MHYIALGFLLFSFPRNSGEGRVLEVHGVGVYYQKPDIAYLQIGAVTEAEKASEAYESNSSIMNKLRNTLIKKGIKKEDIRTIVFSLEPVYQYERGERIFKGYRMSHIYQVKIRNLEKVGEIIDASTATGATTIKGIFFDIEEKEKAEDEARKRAVEDAIRKAKVLSESARIKLGEILKIEESITKPPMPMMKRMAMMQEAGGPAVEPGEMKIEARVYIKFAISE